jgi:type IV pilus assembly protein PilC
MFWSRRLPLWALIDLARSARHALTSGLFLRDVMDLLASKGTRPVRRVAGRIGKDLKAGWSFDDALRKQESYFPPLFVSLATVGEESGHLPEVLHELEKYYILQQKLRRDFLNSISWPVIQFVSAVLIVALLILVLGELPTAGPQGGKFDALGMGLLGARGALIFLGWVGGTLVGVTAAFLVLKKLLRKRAVVERVLLLVPAVGPCLRAMALTRFCIAGRLMLETSLSIFKSLRLAFLATDNAAFIQRYPAVEASLRQGNGITTSFERARVFPTKFMSAMAVAEESGRLPETLRYQGEEYDDEMRRRLGWLTRLAGGLIWLAVAAVIILVIVRIYGNYIGIIDALSDPFQRGAGPPRP